MKRAAQLKREVGAIRAWGIRASLACVALFLVVSGWDWFRTQATFDQALLVLIRAGLLFGLVFGLAWVMSVVHQRLERMPDSGDDEA